jgi:hypothetical protein
MPRELPIPLKDNGSIVVRPWQWKGGKKAANDRYKKAHRDAILKQKRQAYRKNPQENAERSMLWRKKNPEKWRKLMRESNKRLRDRLRSEMLEAYGGKCQCCGETEKLFLELDHIDNDGKVDRETGDGGGVKLLGRLKKKGWPKDKYQILCSNCNQGKRRNGGVCPHKEINCAK